MTGFRMHRRRPIHPVVLALIAAKLGLISCRDELVQTASRSPDASTVDGGMDCLVAEPATELPPGTDFGEGDVLEPLPLAAGSYGALEGPGLYVAARDTFRVYVNGHLIGQSARPRQPLFIPLSLLPGENVIAVAVHAKSGTPAALVALEELARSYVSGSDWKVSAAPTGEWKGTGYDDGGWSAASELGASGSLSGCEPGGAFPPSTTPVWIGPALGAPGPVVLRKTIHIEPIGFAAGVSGGAAATPQRVSTWSELEALATSPAPATILLDEGLHDFRRTGDEVAAKQTCPRVCADNPARTIYTGLPSGSTCAATVVMTERDDRVLRVGSNKTLVGLGRGAAIRGVTLALGASQNLILRNVMLFDINHGILEAGDALSLSKASGVWLDHITIKWVADAFAEIQAGTENLTISYALFEGGTVAECGGQERWGMTITDAKVTIHHSRFDQLSTRSPAVQGSAARVHLFNNVYSNSADWTVGSACLAQVLLEGSVFENVEVVSRISTCSGTTELGLMNAVAGSNVYRDGTAVHTGGDAAEPHDAVFEPPYEYEAELGTDAWPQVILRAGTGGPWALPVTLD